MNKFSSENSTALVLADNKNRKRLLDGVHIETSAPKAIPVNLVRRQNETMALAHSNKLNIHFLGHSPVFSETKIYCGETSDWALMNLNHDPLFRAQKNKLYAPKSVVTEIQTAVNAGIKLDSIYIAHEVAKGKLQPGKPLSLELLVPPPSAKMQRRLSIIEKTSNQWWKFVAYFSAGAIAAPTAALASPFLAVASAGLDPVLLGVQFDPRWTVEGKPIGLWYYITAWNWAEMED